MEERRADWRKEAVEDGGKEGLGRRSNTVLFIKIWHKKIIVFGPQRNN